MVMHVRVCAGCAVGGQVLLLAWTVDVSCASNRFSRVGLAVFWGVCAPHHF